MKNKKGFTLIELLAIIVVMALILITAIPKAIDIIDDSRTGTWNNSVKGVAKAINKSITTLNPDTDGYMYNVNELCSNTSKLKEIVDIENANVTCSGNTFTLTGKGKFEGKTGKIVCSNSKCVPYEDAQPEVKLAAGLYDDSDNLLATWDELINTYGMNINWYNTGYPTNYFYIDYVNEEIRSQYNGVVEVGWYHYRASDDSYVPVDITTVESSEPAVVFSKYEPLRTGKKLVISDSVERINEEAFSHALLTSIIIPESVKRIDEYAFSSSRIKSITIPDSVEYIGTGMVSGTKITSISIPSSVMSMGGLGMLPDLNTVYVDPDNPRYETRDNCNCIIDKTNQELISGSSVGIIPDGVVTIGADAFNSIPITTISIPNSVTVIGSMAFAGTPLTSITLPNKLISIGFGAFTSSSLTSITIPKSVLQIGWGAFHKTNLKSAVFEDPNGWTFSSSILSNPTQAAEYLAVSHYNYTWYKGD